MDCPVYDHIYDVKSPFDSFGEYLHLCRLSPLMDVVCGIFYYQYRPAGDVSFDV